LLLVPGVDIYYAENIEMHKKLQEAGVEIAMQEYAEAVHPFVSMDADLPSGDRGMSDLVNFVRAKNASLSKL
jgi:acetyl esterase/lipase